MPESLPSQISIAVVDDHPILCHSISILLQQEKGWRVCGFAENASDAKAMMDRCRPQLLIVDISLKESHGLDLIKDIRAFHPKVKILAFSQHDEAQYGERTIRAGADGYLMKSERPEKLLEAIRTILRGETYLSERMSKILLQQTLGRGSCPSVVNSPSQSRLTDREITILQLMGQGMGTRQIAGSLNLSMKTIDAHRANLKQKLGLRDSVELICYASRWTLESANASKAPAAEVMP